MIVYPYTFNYKSLTQDNTLKFWYFSSMSDSYFICTMCYKALLFHGMVNIYN